MERVAANDPKALNEHGLDLYEKGDYDEAFQYYKRAAELGDAEAHFNLAALYSNGEGVEKDEEKERHHLEKAAILGQPEARFNLACCEESNGKIERAVKHWIIAAKLGLDDSIQELKRCYKEGAVSKEDFAAALRTHHAAKVATKSPEREAAEKAESYDW